ncbi:MAG: tetratricopeptide repeat protein [Chloroflexaceae bacterium]|nr:tetratricopeptide repeat protein [Chloroflexaceae bacterium]
MIGLWGNSEGASPVAPVSTAQVLAAKEQGYQAVLRREPDNPTALLGLADTRLKMEDLEGALVPLERLATLYPEDARVSVMVEALKQRIAEEEAGDAATQKQPAEP